MIEERKYICPVARNPLVIDGETFYPANDLKLTDREIEKALLELGETEEKRNECLQELKKKLSNDENMEYLMDDSYLLRYLRFRKFDCEETYKMMKYYYAQKIKYSEVFSVSPKIEEFLSYHGIYYLPYADEQDRIIFMCDFAKWNPDEVSYMESLSTMVTIADIATLIPKCQVNGIVTIWDVKGLTARQISESLKLNGIIVFFKVFQMAILGSDLNELHEYVNPHLLPKTLGGTLDEKECKINQNILDNLPFLRYERSFTSR